MALNKVSRLMMQRVSRVREQQRVPKKDVICNNSNDNFAATESLATWQHPHLFRNALAGSSLAVVLALSGCASPPPQQQAPMDPPAAKADVAPAKEPVVTAPMPEAEPVAAEPAAEMAPAKEPAPEPMAMPAAKPEPMMEKPAEPAKAMAADAAKPVKRAMPTDPNTFLVTADAKNESHPFYGVGDKRGFYVNGEPGKDLILRRGETYKFEVDTGVQHDFYFSTSPKGWGAGTVTDGIEGQFTYEGTVVFKPGTTTPDKLYYQCRNHKNMGGRIYVADKGQAVTIEEHKKPVARSDRPGMKVTSSQVKQKLAYAKMIMADTAKVVKTIESGSNAEAKGLLQQAREYLTKSEQELAKGNEAPALAAVDEALRLKNAASRMVSTADAGVDYKARYETLHTEVAGYEKSYGKNLKHVKDKKALEAKFSKADFDKLVKQAESQAASGAHEDAVKNLEKARNQITAALTSMLDSVTVVYDKEFSSPSEEYEYELARNESYAELIPIAIEQRGPNPRQVEMMNQFVEKSNRIVGEGKALADKGDYSMAIQAMQAATDNLRRALMVVGVR